MDIESEIEGPFADDLSQINLAIGRLPSGSKLSSHSRDSFHEPLLPRRASSGSHARGQRPDSRLNQKTYIASEDLTIVFAGFSTSFGGFLLYTTCCILTFGFAYLLFRWLPRWRVGLVGRPTPLRKCQWVAIEVRSLSSATWGCYLLIPLKDQWNQFTVENVSSQAYGRPLSTVFSDSQEYLCDEENDPPIFHLRYIDYRYLRFCYHPLEDKFFLLSGWKDPLWENVKVMRAGLDADDRDSRELVFGKNILEIQQKSVPQLLMDEVRSPLASRTFSVISQVKAFHPFYIFQIASLTLWSLDEYYYYAVCIFLISFFSIGATVAETKSVCRSLVKAVICVC